MDQYSDADDWAKLFARVLNRETLQHLVQFLAEEGTEELCEEINRIIDEPCCDGVAYCRQHNPGGAIGSIGVRNDGTSWSV